MKQIVPDKNYNLAWYRVRRQFSGSILRWSVFFNLPVLFGMWWRHSNRSLGPEGSSCTGRYRCVGVCVPEPGAVSTEWIGRKRRAGKPVFPVCTGWWPHRRDEMRTNLTYIPNYKGASKYRRERTWETYHPFERENCDRVVTRVINPNENPTNGNSIFGP